MIDKQSNLYKQLQERDQLHVLKFWDELSAIEQDELTRQLESIDFSLLDEFVNMLQQSNEMSQEIEACEVHKRCECNHHQEVGEAMIRKGELGVLTVAGGDGTRLGWSGPKGTYPATPLSGKSLFQLIAEQIVYAQERYGVTIPWYIMTSVSNSELTKSFLLDNNCFGLDRADIFVFEQKQVPTLDEHGNLILNTKSSFVTNPDGHGGIISGLQQSGALAEMEGRGIQYLSYVQVDNPLARVVDPIFLAMHATDDDSSNEVSSKCVPKTNPEERVGVFCKKDGRVSIQEYSDLTDEQASGTTEGELTFGAGSIAIHMFSRAFLDQIASTLPWHKARKKVAALEGECNAIKFETFVFDVLPMAADSLVVQVKREDEFAPIKNANGDDSPATSQALQASRSRRWLIEAGIDIEDGAEVELSPLSGASPREINVSEIPNPIKSGQQHVV